MEILVFIVIVIGFGLLVGLLSRKKGDGMLDTLGSGCKAMFGLLFLVLLILVGLIVAYANGVFG
jgi:hypothetical protein